MNFSSAQQFLGTDEKRRETRYPFHWLVEIIMTNAPVPTVYPGTTHDVSAQGCAVLTDFNIPPGSSVAVRLMLPAMKPGAAREIVEADARIAHTVFAEGKFRSGMQFVQFRQDSQRTFLRAIGLRAASSVGRTD